MQIMQEPSVTFVYTRRDRFKSPPLFSEHQKVKNYCKQNTIHKKVCRINEKRDSYKIFPLPQAINLQNADTDKSLPFFA